MVRSKKTSAFTLIELIIVIAIIAILAAAIFVAIDPARRLHESRNARRWSDVTTILDAVVKCQVDNGGTHCGDVASVDNDFYMIGAGTGSVACDGYSSESAACAGTGGVAADCVDLASIGSNYIGANPVDPQNGTSDVTQYWISIDTNGAVTVGACDEEAEGPGGTGDTPTIELTR